MKKLYLALITPLLLTILTACGEQQAALSAPRITSFSANPGTLTAGENEVTLSWEIQGAATELSIDPDVGLVAGTSVRVAPTTTTTYTLTASNAKGSARAEVTVAVPSPEPPEPPQPLPGTSGPNNDLFGEWAFEVVGEAGTTISGKALIDSDFTYEGSAGVWGIVSGCQSAKVACARASVAGIIHDPDTDAYRFGLGSYGAEITVVFIAEDTDGQLSEDGAGQPLLEGSGLIGEDEPATFKAYQVSDEY